MMFRKGVSALIRNQKNEFLLVNLTTFEERYFAVPGGGMEVGESMGQAVYREISEELGIKSSLLEKRGVSMNPVVTTFKAPKTDRSGKEYHGSERFFFAFDYRGTEADIKIASSEVRAYRWVAFADLGKYLLFENQLSSTVAKIDELFSKRRVSIYIQLTLFISAIFCSKLIFWSIDDPEGANLLIVSATTLMLYLVFLPLSQYIRRVCKS